MDLKKFIKENDNYFEDLMTRTTFHSNSIEGNTLSMPETYAILFNQNDVVVTAQPHELYEVINHKYALDFMFNHMENDLTENNIIGLAKLINKNIDEIYGYRKTQVFLKGTEYVPPQANQIKQKMMYFINNYNNTSYLDIFEKIAFNHIEFERIHPFTDGNGRTGRLLIWYELLKNNLPFSVITKENKLDYINYLSTQDVISLANLLRDLSNIEMERIQRFI